MKTKAFALFLVFLFALISVVIISHRLPEVEKIIYPEAKIQSEKTLFKSSEAPKFILSLGERDQRESRFSSIINKVGADEEPKIEAVIYAQNQAKQDFVQIEIQKTENGQYEISVPPPRTFTPGKYQLSVSLTENGATQKITQDFSWGVLAINTNKSIFFPGEEAKIYFGVLDETGHTVCDALLRLAIRRTSEGQAQILSTEDGTIKYSGECAKDNVTYTPDYSAIYKVGEEGIYQMELTAQTKNGEYQIVDSFQVSRDIPFDIERVGPTRINPTSPYDFKIKVKANQDFEGEVVEGVPSKFQISNFKFQIEENQDTKQIIWPVSLRKGEVKEFTYTYDAPDVSPEFHLLGPIELHKTTQSETQNNAIGVNSCGEASNSCELVFKELRSWQIANDGVGEVILLWDSSVATPSGWTCISCTYGDPYYQIYPRGAASYGASTAGTASHTHTLTYVNESASGDTAAFDSATGTLYSAAVGHTHGGLASQTVPDVSNDPSFRTLRFIRSTGTPTTIPSGAIGMFDTTSLPTNWQAYSSEDTYFLQGDDIIETGGQNTHTHSITATSSNTNSSFQSSSTPIANAPTTTHSHPCSGTSDNVDKQPPYKEVVFAKATQDTSIPAGLIAMFDETPPSGWSSISGISQALNGYFIKGDSSTPGGTGGNENHTTHANLGLSCTQTTNVISTDNNPLQGGSALAHTHTINVSFTSNASVPVYRNTIFAQKSPEVAGTIYNGDGTAYNCSSNNLTVAVSKNGGTPDTGTCISVNGTYAVGVSATTAGDVLTVFLNDETPNATTVSKAAGTSGASGIDLYVDHVILRHENATALTNQEINNYDYVNGGSDGDVPFQVDLSGTYNLTVHSGYILWVWTGKTFDPGGTVSTNATGGNLIVGASATAYLDTGTSAIGKDIIASGSATLDIQATTTVAGGDVTTTGTSATISCTISSTLTVRGTGSIGGGTTPSITFCNLAIGDATATAATTITSNIIVTGGALTTYDTSTLTYSGTPTVNISAGTGNVGGGSGSITFYDLTIGGTQTITSAITADNDLSVGGTMNGSVNVTVKGSVSGAGTINMSGGTFDQRVAAAENFGTTSGSNPWTFSTLKFSNSSSLSRTITTQAGSGGITVSVLLQIGNDGPTDSYPTVLNAGDRTWTLSSTNGTPFDIKTSTNGISTLTGSTSTFSYTGVNGSGDTAVQSTTGSSYYYNLTFNGAETYAAEGAVIVNNDLTVTTGTLAMGASNLTVGTDTTTGDISVAGSLTQSASGTTTVKTFNANTAIVGGAGTLTFYHLSLSPTNSGGTIRLGSGASQTITVLGNLTVGNGTQTVIVDANTNDPTINVTSNVTIATNGTLQSTSGTLTLGGSYANSGTFTHGSGTVKLNDTTGSKTLTGTMVSPSNFNNLTFDGSGGAWSFAANPATVANDFTITNGTVTAPSTTLTITGNYSNNTGVFTHNNGLVVMNAGDASNTLTGTMTTTSSFYDLQFNNGAGSWTFGTNPATVANNFTITLGTVTAPSTTLTITGNYNNAGGTFTHGSGTVVFNASDGSNTLGGTMTTTSSFYNLQFNNAAGSWTFGANPATVANDFTITLGTVTAPSTTLTITGNYNNAGGTFTHGSGTVTFNAGDTGNTLQGTMTSTSSFYNLEFNNSAGAWSFAANSATVANNFTITNTTAVGGVTAPSTTLTIGGNFTKSAGTFTHNSGTVVFNDNAKVSILTYNAAITFNTFTVNTASKEINFDNADQTNIAGTFTIYGGACGTKVKLYSDSSPNQYEINATGSKSVQFADIKDSYAAAAITATDSLSSGNVTGLWTITGNTCGGVTVSGNAYADESSTAWVPCDNSTANISLIVNGGTVQTTSCDDTTGAYTFYTVATALNNPVSVFLNATNKGIATTVAADNSSSITLNPRMDRVWVKTEGAVASISNANLDLSDKNVTGCSNVPYTVTTNNLTVDSGYELHVQSSKTYDPGGTVTTNATGGVLHVDDSAIAYLDSATSDIGNNINVDTGAYLYIDASAIVRGNLTIAGTLSKSTGSPTVTTRGTNDISGGGTIIFYNLIVGDATTSTTTISSTTSVTNDFSVGTGSTLNGSSNLTVNGAFTGTGTVTMSGGTVEQRVAEGENFGGTGGNTWTFSTLMFSNSGGSGFTVTTQSDAGGITVSTLLQIGKAGDGQNTTLNAGNRTWTLSGTSGTPFDIIGSSALSASTSTFSYTGANGSGDTTVQAATYYHLTINASDTFVPDGELVVNGDLTVTTGSLTVGSNNLAVGSASVDNSGDIAVAGSLTQTGGTTTARAPSVGAPYIGGAGTLTFYNLTLAPTVNGRTIYLGSGGSQTITVSNDLTIGNGSNSVTVNADSNDPVLDVNGNFAIATSGIFQASYTASFTVAKNFTNNGTFTHNSGMVTFDTADTSVFDGSGTPAITFYSFSSATAGKTLQFTASKVFRIEGIFTVTGQPGSKITINSTTGTQWQIDHQGTEGVTNATVQNSGCYTGTTTVSLDTTDSDLGNNGSCWAFQIGKRVKAGVRIKGGVRIK